MKKLFSTSVLYLLCLVLAGGSVNAQVVGDVCKDEVKHPGKMFCLKSVFAKEERKLDKVYESAFVHIKNSDAKKLIKNYWVTALEKAQKQWKKYREKDCREPLPYEKGGGVAGEQAVFYCLIKKTRERTEELESRYKLNQPAPKAGASAVQAQIKAPIIYARVFKSTAQDNPLVNGCPGTVRVTASSDFENRATGDLSVGSLIDKNRATAWLAGTEGQETGGAWVEFTITSLKGTGTDSIVYTFQVLNGFTSADSTWGQNARVQDMAGYYNGQLAFVVHLENSREFQEFNFGLVQGVNKPRYKIGDKIKFVITKIYKGTRNRNVYLSTLLPKCN